ncbi:MAG: FIST C-terminal domain-containing protein [Treponema sp.]|nr:FIST C-terminal domain-containing protein [Treponema sp.]
MSAYTFEIDDVAIAVSEILAQLNVEHTLCAHTVGLMTCYDEFIETGVTKAISDALPFDIIGCSTMANAFAGELGEMMLCLTVLTSDEVLFSAGVTQSLIEIQDAPLIAAYQEARRILPGEPGMMLMCGPIISQLGGEILVEKLDAITGGIPLFGTLAGNHRIDHLKSHTIFNGQSSNDILSFVLVYGPIHPSFFVTTIPGEKIKNQKAIITKAADNILMEINHLPVQVYMEHLGIDAWVATTSFPFLIDYNDGTKPVLRSIYAFTPEGYAVCGGRMPIGTTIMVGDIDYADVMYTTGETVKQILQVPEPSCILMFSCLARYLVQGADPTAELEQVRSSLHDTVYQFCYSGGEICPVYNEHGRLVNRFHNCTLIACVL